MKDQHSSSDDFSFAQFDDEPTSSQKQRPKKSIEIPFLDKFNFDMSLLEGWQWIVALFGVWVVAFLLVIILEHGKLTDANILRMPVMVGHMPYSGGAIGTALLKTLWLWSHTHKVIGLLGLLLWMVLLIVFSLVSVIGSMFIHASVGHLLGNIFFMLVFAVIARLLGWTYKEVVTKWFVYGLTAMWIPYLLIEIAGTFMRMTHPGINAWYTWFYYSVTPIVGASVGIMAIGGFVLAQAIKNVIHGSTKNWIILIVMIVILIMLSVSATSGLSVKVKDAVTIATYFGSALHVIGCLLGVFFGFMAPKVTENKTVGYN